MAEKYTNYHQYIQGLELARPNNSTENMSIVYETDLNLGMELADLPNGGVVVDIGCCAGVGTAALKRNSQFGRLNLVGVTPTIISRNGRTLSIPIYQGTAEDLSNILKNYDIFPADVLLMRNVMQEICLGEADNTCRAEGITQEVFKELNTSCVILEEKYSSTISMAVESEVLNSMKDITNLEQRLVFL